MTCFDTEAKVNFEMVYYIGLQCLLLKEIKKSGVLRQIIIWLCITRTGNYQIHGFDWLKSILDRLCFAAKTLQTEMQNHQLFSPNNIYGSAKKHDDKKMERERANFGRIKFSSFLFTSKISVSTSQ